jgi:excisionase family DNA binding protein
MSNCNTIVEALVVGPHQTGVMLNCGRTRVYELLAAGELDSFRDGRARKITVASIHRYIERRLAAEKEALGRTDTPTRDDR